jgi:hypothetical protein
MSIKIFSAHPSARDSDSRVAEGLNHGTTLRLGSKLGEHEVKVQMPGQVKLPGNLLGRPKSMPVHLEEVPASRRDDRVDVVDHGPEQPAAGDVQSVGVGDLIAYRPGSEQGSLSSSGHGRTVEATGCNRQRFSNVFL